MYSAANFSVSEDALVDYFNYADFASYVERVDYNDSIWENLLKIEIDASRPVLYSGSSSTGDEYAFVCDGYDDNDFFHFNWGYGGTFDGYYFLGNINPGGANVSFNQSAIIGITPASPLPIANFEADVLIIPAGDLVQFTDLSIGNPTACPSLVAWFAHCNITKNTLFDIDQAWYDLVFEKVKYDTRRNIMNSSLLEADGILVED